MAILPFGRPPNTDERVAIVAEILEIFDTSKTESEKWMDVLPVPCCDFYGTRHSARKGSDPTSVQKYLETEKRQNPLNTESDRDRDVTDKGHRRA